MSNLKNLLKSNSVREVLIKNFEDVNLTEGSDIKEEVSKLIKMCKKRLAGAEKSSHGVMSDEEHSALFGEIDKWEDAINDLEDIIEGKRGSNISKVLEELIKEYKKIIKDLPKDWLDDEEDSMYNAMELVVDEVISELESILK